MTKQLADAILLLEKLIADCDTGPGEHAWAKCRHCSAVAQIQDNDPLAHRLITLVIETLKQAR